MSDRLRALIDAFDGEATLDRARTIPAPWYSDPELAAAECRGVFAASWQPVARIAQLTEPGSFVTARVADEPVLVVRGQDGVLRAFYNVCRHRAACVASEEFGRASRLRCRYHGWTYDLTGRLIGTPEFDGVSDFRREDNGLEPIRVDTWGLWVWVHLGNDQVPLRQLLGPLDLHSVPPALASMQFAERRTYELACNWKVFVDNYLDGGYHIHTVHPGLAGVLDYSQYRTEVAGETAVQISPMVDPRPGGGGDESAAVAGVRQGTTAQYWWVFPNLMLNLYAEVLDTNLVVPLGPDRCRVIFDFYFVHPEPAFVSESIRVADEIQQEDVGICEEVQRGLSSRSFSTGRFSVRREAAGYHFHQLLARRLRAVSRERDR